MPVTLNRQETLENNRDQGKPEPQINRRPRSI